jgi:hypothetical protein
MMYSFYDAATGTLLNRRFTGTAEYIPANTPPGHVAIAGQFDHLSQRVDIVTMEVIDWQSPQPADSSLKTWHWRTDECGAPRWVSSPTDLARTQQAQEKIKVQIDNLEKTQNRALRELALDGGKQDAKNALRVIEDQMVLLRAEFNAPTLPPVIPLPPEPVPRPPVPAIVFAPEVPPILPLPPP